MSLVETALQKARSEQARASNTASNQTPPADGRQNAGLTQPSSSLQSTARQPTIELSQAKLVSEGLLPPRDQERVHLNQFRMLKRPILQCIAQTDQQLSHHANVVAVTSALPGDGKSYIAMNLAHTLSMERNSTVVLIDADVTKRHLSIALGLGSKPGLTDALRSEQVALSDILYPTSTPGFFVIPAGQSGEQATELFTSARMQQLLTELATDFPKNIVLIDAGPLLVTSYATVLAGLAQQVLLVVRAEHTPQGVVKESAQRLAQCKNVQVVLNAWRPFGLLDSHYYTEYEEYLRK